MKLNFRGMCAPFLFALAACSEPAPESPRGEPLQPAKEEPPKEEPKTVETVTVELKPASGSNVTGTIEVMPMGDGVHFTGEVKGLDKGATHAIHVHETGDCSAPDAASAGGHFNPGGSDHGRMGTPVHHAGDMDNLTADENGVAKVNLHVSGLTLGDGGPNDVSGRAIVVHAGPDDYVSQPAGNSGARVACGVIPRSGG